MMWRCLICLRIIFTNFHSQSSSNLFPVVFWPTLLSFCFPSSLMTPMLVLMRSHSGFPGAATTTQQLLGHSVIPLSLLVSWCVWDGNGGEGTADSPRSRPLVPECCSSGLVLPWGFSVWAPTPHPSLNLLLRKTLLWLEGSLRQPRALRVSWSPCNNKSSPQSWF